MGDLELSQQLALEPVQILPPSRAPLRPGHLVVDVQHPKLLRLFRTSDSFLAGRVRDDWLQRNYAFFQGETRKLA